MIINKTYIYMLYTENGNDKPSENTKNLKNLMEIDIF